MLKRSILMLALIMPASIIFPQNDTVKDDTQVKKQGSSEKPLQITNTDVFTIEHLTFNKKIDPSGRGELLQIEFALKNNMDAPMNLHIFLLGTIEETEWVWNSFNNRKISLKEISIKYFASTPDDASQFEREENGKKKIVKYPKDFKTGINPLTGKIYTLENYLPVRTELLSKYRKKYKYFNNATIYIFDDDGNLLFYQNYSLDKLRKH